MQTVQNKNRKSGFTLIEIIITIAIISIIISVLLVNYDTFSSRSVLRTRIADIQSYITLAQARSTSGVLVKEHENLTKDSDIYQNIILHVENGQLIKIRSSEKIGNTEPFSVLDNNVVETTTYTNITDLFKLEACYINLEYENFLLGDIEPTSENGDITIFLSIHYPTKEIKATIRKNGESVSLDGDVIHDGIRIALSLLDKSITRSIDIYSSGLIDTNGNHTESGCSEDAHIKSSVSSLKKRAEDQAEKGAIQNNGTALCANIRESVHSGVTISSSWGASNVCSLDSHASTGLCCKSITITDTPPDTTPDIKWVLWNQLSNSKYFCLDSTNNEMSEIDSVNLTDTKCI